MASTLIVGAGPGGLSAALLFARRDQDVVVYGEDRTAMHHAFLSNHLGVPSVAGSEFQEVGRRQVESFGSRIVNAAVTAVAVTAEGYQVTLGDGSMDHGNHLVLNEGRTPALAASPGLAMSEDGGVAVDRDGRTSVAGVYVVGRRARPTRSQAIISAGAGAATALDILALEAGEDAQDRDSPPREGP